MALVDKAETERKKQEKREEFNKKHFEKSTCIWSVFGYAVDHDACTDHLGI